MHVNLANAARVKYPVACCGGFDLSDTTLDKVHEAANEIIREFNQSSVLIQTNKTKTEFYEGK